MLRRVGIVLMVVGALDIAYMVYCLFAGVSYSSSLNVFALAAGILLYRGSLGVARIGAHATAFVLGAIMALALTLPVLVPPRLLLLGVLMDAAPTPLGWALSLAAPVVLAAWVHRQLTSAPVRAALARPLTTRWTLAAGAALALLLALAVSRAMRGDTHDRVVAAAREDLGPGYEYFVTRMEMSHTPDGDSVSALVLAYDAEHVEPVPVICAGAGQQLACQSRREGASDDGELIEEGASEATSAMAANDDLATGHDHYRGSDFRAAIDAYDRALEIDPTSTEARFWRGMSHVRLGERELALEDFDGCIARDDDDIDVYIEADRLLAPSRDWTRIIDNWSRFIDRNPSNGRAYYERGGAIQKTGDMERALADAEESCRLGFGPGCQVVERYSRPR